MEHIAALFQIVAITVISAFTSQLNSLPTPILNQNIPANIISPEGNTKTSTTFGPFYDKKDQEASGSIALDLPSSPPIIFPTIEPTQIKLSLSPTRTLTPTKNPSSTPDSGYPSAGGPTQIPTPSPTPYVFNLPAQTIINNSPRLDADYIFTKVNEHRSSIDLALFEKDEQICKIAAARAPEIQAEVETGQYHSGLRSRQIPYWINENIATYNSEDAMINWWLNDYIHKIAIEGNYRYSCVACSGISCTQLFTSYIPK